MRKRYFLTFLVAIVCFVVLIPFFAYAAKSKPTVEEVASKLSCYCGTCPHLVVTQCGCGTAAQILADVQQKIDAGWTEEQIIQGYVAQYGEQVLSAPPKKGFSLTAWILPFLGFVVGGVALVTYLKHQQKDAADKTSQAPVAESKKEASEEDIVYRQLLEQELSQRK